MQKGRFKQNRTFGVKVTWVVKANKLHNSYNIIEKFFHYEIMFYF